MLFTYILKTIMDFILGILNIIPDFSLPGNVLNLLKNAIGYWNTATLIFPPLSIIWTYFLYIIAFEIIVILIKVILGSRSPIQ